MNNPKEQVKAIENDEFDYIANLGNEDALQVLKNKLNEACIRNARIKNREAALTQGLKVAREALESSLSVGEIQFRSCHLASDVRDRIESALYLLSQLLKTQE